MIGKSYRKPNVTAIHEDHDETPDTSEVIDVRQDHEYDGDNVMSQHLVMVLPTRLCM